MWSRQERCSHLSLLSLCQFNCTTDVTKLLTLPSMLALASLLYSLRLSLCLRLSYTYIYIHTLLWYANWLNIICYCNCYNFVCNGESWVVHLWFIIHKIHYIANFLMKKPAGSQYQQYKLQVWFDQLPHHFIILIRFLFLYLDTYIHTIKALNQGSEYLPEIINDAMRKGVE